MFFRPSLWMTICAVPALIILLGLGSWQVHRLQWKESLIAELATNAHSVAELPPIGTDPIKQFQRLRVRGVWMHEAEVQLIGRVFEGTPGYHVITPMRLNDGRILLMNRGWVSQDYRRPETRPSSLAQGEQVIEAILRLPARKGYFVPENNPTGDDWFTLTITDIASHHNLGDSVITAYTADVLRGEGALALPIGAQINIDIANNHLNYAITWYGIAASLIGVYGAWHHQAGRLGRKR